MVIFIQIKLFYYFIYINLCYLLVYSKSEKNDFKILKLLDSGEQVKKCQEKLISLNYNCGPFGADGYFRISTKNCIKDFQLHNELNVTGTIEELTYNKLFSNNANGYIYKNITSVNYSNGLCSLDGIKNSISQSKIIYKKKRDHRSYQNKVEKRIGVEAEININELLTQLFSLLGYAFDGKNEATINSIYGDDLEICYVDSNVVISCYCHESKKHFSSAYGDEIKVRYADPGEIACSKELRSLLRSMDHCESGTFDEQDDAILYIENEKSSFKRKKTWYWVLIIAGAIFILLVICCCIGCIAIIKNSETQENNN